MPEDRSAPKLRDGYVAAEHLTRAAAKKVTLLHILGPCPVTLQIVPREDPKRVFQAFVQGDAIVAYRNDACVLSYSTRGCAVAVQVDFLARTRVGQLQAPRDLLPLPQDLQAWHEECLRSANNARSLEEETVPLPLMRMTRLL
eukprot:CAMPEP_0172913522 /NCGR_PEP_ID=MMETSP1075-20121228/190545_1 /TAXON_ID=2916 /ORGANISM="Ceratium fusus, Strain PA161109" /LENGTH=142 /DNA_ID=CAMNT_0013772251 /DNA_START=30 /DNA_END=454 /DNA_ORIENTATION=+